ncbi:Gag protease polyprotein-like protein [Gossypium australe]|uniref:Gag protease polyprotein-like protein n=1 Tax=Gossypium australe TaxID=47621 RepID=A0A5B6UYK0_9ROSI|nr:Gag protease polyprotein-like protein [Gossypium australe]
MRSNGAELFRGVTRVAPTVVEYWLKATERIINDLDCTLERALNMSNYHGIIFEMPFKGERSVAEYEAKFLQLSRYARGLGERVFAALVDKAKIAEEVKRTEGKRRDREKSQNKNKRDSGPSSTFQRSTKQARFDRPPQTEPVARVESTVPACRYCNRRHSSECWRRIGACFRCGVVGHKIIECPLMVELRQALIQGLVSNLLGVVVRFGMVMVADVVKEHQAEVQDKLKLDNQLWFMRRHHEDRDAADVIVGTFIIHSLSYFALIDCRSMHYYVSNGVVGNLGIVAEDTSRELSVISPLGQFVQVSKVYRRCRIEVHGFMFPVDSMELPFGGFDLILGTDWLVEHWVGLEYKSKRVTFKNGDNLEVVMLGERQVYFSNVIPALVAEKLVRKGCYAYLAYVCDTSSVGSTIEEIHTVKDFPEVFPEELSGLPLDREVEFRIKLFLGTAPVSIVPYRMAPKELKKLKLQLQELLDRGFI